MVTLVFLAGACLLGLLLVARLTDRVIAMPIEMLDMFALYAFLPFLGVALAALVLWSRALAMLSLVVLLFFGQQFGGPVLSKLAIPSRAAAAMAGRADQPKLRVLTMNLHSQYTVQDSLLTLIRETQPDVVLLQEANTWYVKELEGLVGKAYPFSATVGLETAHAGSITLSRLPLLDRQALRPTPWGNYMHRVLLSTGSGEVWLYNVHLANPIGDERHDGRFSMLRRYNSTFRDGELQWLIQETASLDKPFIVAGDFNIAAGSRPYRAFPAFWRDAFATAGEGFGHTFPSPLHEGDGRFAIPIPLIRIDYILTSRQIQAVDAWTEETVGADHFAVLSDLELPSTR